MHSSVVWYDHSMMVMMSCSLIRIHYFRYYWLKSMVNDDDDDDFVLFDLLMNDELKNEEENLFSLFQLNNLIWQEMNSIRLVIDSMEKATGIFQFAFLFFHHSFESNFLFIHQMHWLISSMLIVFLFFLKIKVSFSLSSTVKAF